MESVIYKKSNTNNYIKRALFRSLLAKLIKLPRSLQILFTIVGDFYPNLVRITKSFTLKKYFQGFLGILSFVSLGFIFLWVIDIICISKKKIIWLN